MAGVSAVWLVRVSLPQALNVSQVAGVRGWARLRCARLENNSRSNTSFLSTTVARAMSLGTSPSEDDHDAPRPIKFSTSDASNRKWTVDKSLGSRFQKPWWKVLPISLFGILFLTWCVLRKETEIDKMLEKALNEHLPGYKDLYEEPEETEDQPGKGT